MNEFGTPSLPEVEVSKVQLLLTTEELDLVYNALECQKEVAGTQWFDAVQKVQDGELEPVCAEETMAHFLRVRSLAMRVRPPWLGEGE